MKTVWKDIVLRLFFINMFLVIIGYALAGLTGMLSNVVMAPLKTIVLLYSIFITLKNLNRIDFEILKRHTHVLILFITLIIGLLFFSQDFFKTIERSSQFMIPFIYLYFAAAYFSLNYSQSQLWYSYLFMLNIVYLLPVIYFMIIGEGFSAQNIYGIEEGEAFASNHYGWSSLVFILTYVDLLKNYKLPDKYKWIAACFLIPAFYLLFISGNRASYLCFMIAGLIFMVIQNTANWLIKIGIVCIAIFYIGEQLSNENSILNERIKKTELQLEDEEENLDTRRTAMQTGFQVMDKHPESYIIGFGLFSFREAIVLLEPSVNFDRIRSGVHNSYLEMFFGSGILVFSIFIFSYIISPLSIYFREFKSNFLFVLPVFIIPFFESNLTGGQFLFYPWLFTAMLLKFRYLYNGEKKENDSEKGKINN